jgi:hypothetical protein
MVMAWGACFLVGVDEVVASSYADVVGDVPVDGGEDDAGRGARWRSW